MRERIEKTYGKALRGVMHSVNPIKKKIITTHCTIHKFINMQAIAILMNEGLANEGLAKENEFYKEHIKPLNEGVAWADQDFKSSNHFYQEKNKNFNNSSIKWRNYFLFVEIFIVVINWRLGGEIMFEHLYRINKDIYIDLRNEIFTGDVLDIGLDNYGIIYNLYKLQNRDAKLDYLQGKGEKDLIGKEAYDTSILLFSLSSIWLKTNKKSLFKDISSFLKEDGTLHIWDIDKSFSKPFRSKIKVLLPESNIKEINITDLNLFKDASKNSTIRLLKQYFEIIDLKDFDNVYYIKAKKRIKSTLHHQEMHTELKGSTEHENSFSSSKFKIRSQQLGSKIFEGIYKRFKL